MPENDQQTLGADQQSAPGRLLQRLTKLTAESPSAPDASRQLDSSDPFAAIATEIDETILPRTLIFENDRNEKLGLDVASGRILSVSLLELNARAEIEAALTGHAFFDTSDPLCQDLHEAISTFRTGINTLFVRTVIRSESHSFSNIGIALRGLQNAQGNAGSSPVAAFDDQGHSAFAEKIRSVASAVVCTDRHSVVEAWGDKGERMRLELLASEELEQDNEPQPVSQNAPAQIAIWGENTDRGQAVSCASFPRQMVFAITSSENIPLIVRCWAEIFGSTHWTPK